MATKLEEYRRKRNFTKTGEPSGRARRTRASELQFVIQKHDATRLHYDLRLELDGVMKSWAVPKGPSLDPSVKRLAIEVEDHPVEYNAFEGTIPKEEYGGGTVMIWDRGSYEPARPGNDPLATLRRAFERGKVDVVLHGERLRGAFTLVRTRRSDGSSSKAEWLLVKTKDEYAASDLDITAEEMTSVVTGREMEEIATDPPGWSRYREPKQKAAKTTRDAAERAFDTSAVEPMYAHLGSAMPEGDGWTFEPKYDGIRVLAFATADDVRLVTRNGKEKARQFPEVTDALRKLAARARREMVLDGEIVAIADGLPARFQRLQGRMHLTGGSSIESAREATPAALIAFDILVDGADVLLREPWSERRELLEKRLRNRTGAALRLGETLPGDGNVMLERARDAGWEGIIAKSTDAPYRPGVRSRDWLKLKIEFRQEFVVGGWTEPRESRQHLGAILLGYYEGDDLIYAGHTGGGFTRDSLRDMYQRIRQLERKSSPFTTTPRTNERPHWVRPQVVVEVKFNEWTADGKLRQPIFLGVRDDKDPREVKRERTSVQRTDGEKQSATGGSARKRSAGEPDPSDAVQGKASASPSSERQGASEATPSAPRKRGAASSRRPESSRAGTKSASVTGADEDVLSQMIGIEGAGGSGTLHLGRGKTLPVSSLDKLFFPETGYTKGDLMRYYTVVAEHLLPALRDRPLVLKRYPNGVQGEHFFQQRPSPGMPAAVRVGTVRGSDGKSDPRVVGGDLATLLYLVQLGCISMDPWHSRLDSLEWADYAYLDLDPQPKAGFRKVVDVARWVREELDALGLHAALKTSGSRGLHVAIPLPRRTSYDTAVLLAQMIATRVAQRHPRDATVVRAVKGRDAASVYVDYLQNVQGKSIASVYSVRARPEATVSAPLDWPELDDDLDPGAFTMASVPERIARLGDLWGAHIRRLNTAAALRSAAGT